MIGKGGNFNNFDSMIEEEEEDDSIVTPSKKVNHLE